MRSSCRHHMLVVVVWLTTTLSSALIIPNIAPERLQISECEGASDCGGGHCFDGRCIGFANSLSRKYGCKFDEECILHHVKGWFSNDSINSVVAIPASPAFCGNPSIRENYSLNFLKSLKLPNKCQPEGGSQSDCIATLGVLPFNGNVAGEIGLCGCPDLNTDGSKAVCNNLESHLVPLGVVSINDFSSPEVYGLLKGNLGSAVGNECVGRGIFPDTEKCLQRLKHIQRETPIPEYTCTHGSRCLLPHFSGFGLSDKAKIKTSKSSNCDDVEVLESATAEKGEDGFWPCTISKDTNLCTLEIPKLKEKSDKTVFLCGCPVSKTNCHLLGKLHIRQKLLNKEKSGPIFDVPLDKILSKNVYDDRRLQLITDSSANAPKEPDPNDRNGSTQIGECTENIDCLGGFGQCKANMCVGFDADVENSRLFRCVEGYACNIEPGDITGIGIHFGFTVIAIAPSEQCGTAPNLESKKSLFANTNKWSCEGDQSNCTFNVGVGFRRNKSNTVEGVRLCGCPDADANGDNIKCNDVRDYFVPLGRVSIQECITNAHCMDRGFAYCVFDHCGGILATAASVGIKMFQCARNQSCTLDVIGAKALSEGLKVIPVATTFSCGASAALDPDRIQDESLPCLVDVDDNGKCDINMGVTKVMGTSRLCGCSGQDLGGNGRPCDQPEDFDTELGLLKVGECVISTDCKNGEVCAGGQCISDELQPYLTVMNPKNNTISVPPIKTIDLIWNENIKFGPAGKRVILQSLDDENINYTMSIPENTEDLDKVFSPRTLKNRYTMEISSQRVTLTPDTRKNSLPEGRYRLGYEFGFVTDLQGNPNEGDTSLYFTVSDNVGCPYLYMTGFSTENGNPNGLYEAMNPINGKASWQSVKDPVFVIYWKIAYRDQEANWVLDTNLDDQFFLAFPDLELISNLSEEHLHRPPSGNWYKWSGSGRIPQEEVIVYCSMEQDSREPTLIGITPDIGQVGVDTEDPTIIMDFSEPVTFGHWAAITLQGRNTSHRLALVPDWEGGLRQKNIIIDLPKSPDEDYSTAKRVTLKFDESLRKGETYDLIIQLGALTDMAYNPWGPVNKDTIFFTTNGKSCVDLKVNEKSITSVKEGQYNIQCEEGYSVHQNKSIVVMCNEGVVIDLNGDPINDLECKKNCIDPSSSFSLDNLNDIKLISPQRAYYHGEKAIVECKRLLLQGGQKEIECINGEWDNIDSLCQAKGCGEYPEIGQHYRIVGKGTGIGDSRDITCTLPQKSSEKTTVYCLETDEWELPSFDCFMPCSEYINVLTNNNSIITGDGYNHGDSRILRCAPGYTPNDLSIIEGVLKCKDGEWIYEQELNCQVGCSLDVFSKDAYITKLIEGQSAHLGSILEISCKNNATQRGGPSREQITCTDNGWIGKTISCKSSCKHPLEKQLDNTRYITMDIDILGSQSTDTYTHGTVAGLDCQENAYPSSGRLPHRIFCDDGVWRSLQHQRPSQILQEMAPITLECKSSCLLPSTINFNEDKVVLADSSLQHQMRVKPIYSDSLRSTPQFLHLISLDISCGNDNSINAKKTRIQCIDGEWIPPNVTGCNHGCKDITNYLKKNNLKSNNFNNDFLNNGEQISVTCITPEMHLAGSETDIIYCSTDNILKTQNNILCRLPTCFDGIKNGDEKGIDCGGSSCPQSCPDHCNDLIKNYDEIGIDCGGLKCPSCITCKAPTINELSNLGFISSQLEYSLDEGKSFILNLDDIDKRIMSNLNKNASSDIGLNVSGGINTIGLSNKTTQYIYARCNINTHRPTTLNSLVVFGCSGGKWKLLSDSITCRAMSCNDNIKNRDEIDIDCGGSYCPRCGSCFDGIHNNDEIYVDCGGTNCAPCRECPLSVLKRFIQDEKNYEVRVVKTSLQGSQTAHQTHLKITCKKNQTHFLDVQCLNGKWLPSITPSVSLLHSQEKTLNVFKLHYDLRTLETQCTDINDNNDISSQWLDQDLLIYNSFKLNTKNSTDSSICQTNLYEAFNKYTSDECGALLYGASNSKTRSYCLGTCHESLIKSINAISENCEISILSENSLNNYNKILNILNEIITLYCQTAPNNQKINNQQDEKYCFADLPANLNKIQNLNQLVYDENTLIIGCKEQSCFKSNIRYIYLLSQIKEYANIIIGNKIISDNNNNKNMRAFSYLHSLNNIEKITNLLCLKIDGQFCAQYVNEMKELVPRSEVIYSNYSIKPLNSKMIFDQCSHKCTGEIARRIGQALIDDQHNDYDISFGIMLKYYGRINCQESFPSQYCGEAIFPPLTETFAVTPAPAYNYFSINPLDVPQCQCPIEFIADGDCDLSCNTKECFYDGYDCFPTVSLHSIWKNVNRYLPLESSCSPFSESFECQDHCNHKFRNALSEHGCCLASILEVQGELLNLNKKHFFNKNNKIDNIAIDLSTTNPFPINTKSYDQFNNRLILPLTIYNGLKEKKIKTNRSISFFEQSCNVSLDRTCSFALRRNIFTIEMTIDNISYDSAINKMDIIGENIREEISNVLSIPRQDIVFFNTWPGSIITRIIIDAGWLSNTDYFGQIVNNAFNNENSILINNIENELKKILKNNINNQQIKINKNKTNIKQIKTEAPVFSLQKKPDMPLLGTYGMDTFKSKLIIPPCNGHIDLSIPERETREKAYIINYPINNEESIDGNSNIKKLPIDHGVLVTVTCREGYNAVKGTTPQNLICDKGVWIPMVNDQPTLSMSKIECAKPCDTFESVHDLTTQLEYIVKGNGIETHDDRRISCATGYKSTNPEINSQTLKCRNGLWDTRTFFCEEVTLGPEELKQQQQLCLTQLKTLGNDFVYNELLFENDIQTNAYDQFVSSNFSEISSTPFRIYQISCARGFAPYKNDLEMNYDLTENYIVACNNSTLYDIGLLKDTFNTEIITDSKNPQEQAYLQMENMKKYIGKDEYIIDVMEPNHIFINKFACRQIEVAMDEQAEAPLSDGIVIMFLFLGLLFALILLLVLVWICKKYGGPKKLLCKALKKDIFNSNINKQNNHNIPKNNDEEITPKLSIFNSRLDKAYDSNIDSIIPSTKVPSEADPQSLLSPVIAHKLSTGIQQQPYIIDTDANYYRTQFNENPLHNYTNHSDHDESSNDRLQHLNLSSSPHSQGSPYGYSDSYTPTDKSNRQP